jgi:hypothetical protein
MRRTLTRRFTGFSLLVREGRRLQLSERGDAGAARSAFPSINTAPKSSKERR